MNELRDYDDAVGAFFDLQQIKSLPLNSWDYYSEFFVQISNSSEDMVIFNKLAKQHSWQTALDIEDELLLKKHVVVITDADLKIVHASQNMVKMNGYTIKEVVGKTPKIFQGPATSSHSKQLISSAIRAEKSFETVVSNYRKDGSLYKCWIKAQPIYNTKNDVVHFIAYEKEVA